MNSIDDRIAAFEQRLFRAESELAIRNVIVRYGMAADCGDAKTAARCFTDDAEYRISAPRAGRAGQQPGDLVLQGRLAIQQMLESELHQSLLPRSAHTVGPVTVVVRDGVARATGYSRLYHRDQQLADSSAPSLMRMAVNEWRLVHLDNEWLIASRESRLVGEGEAQTLLRAAAYPG